MPFQGDATHHATDGHGADSIGSPQRQTPDLLLGNLARMPAPTDPSGNRGGRRRFAWLFWIGVAIAPVAALLLVLGQGVGPPRAAAVLAVLAVVMIGLSVTFRDDTEAIRDDFREQLRLEVDLVRSDVDSLRRGVELTVHRELERVRGELEAARRETVLRTESTRLSRVTGELPAADRDAHTIEPIYEEYRARATRASRRRAEPEVYRDEPVRVVAARVDSTSREADVHRGGASYDQNGYETPRHDRAAARELEDARAMSARYAEATYDDADRYQADYADYQADYRAEVYEEPGRYGSGRQEPQDDAPSRDPVRADTGRRASRRRRSEEHDNGYDRAGRGYQQDAYDTGTPTNDRGGPGRAADMSAPDPWSASWDSVDEPRSTAGWNPPDRDRGSDWYDAAGEPRVIAGDVVGAPGYSIGGQALSESDFGSGAGFGSGNGFGSGTAFGGSTNGGHDYRRPDLPALPEGSSTASGASSDPWASSWNGSSWSTDPSELATPDRDADAPSGSRHGAPDRGSSRHGSSHGASLNGASSRGGSFDVSAVNGSSFGYGGSLNGSAPDYGVDFDPPNLDHLPPAPSRHGGRHSSTDGYHDPYQ